MFKWIMCSQKFWKKLKDDFKVFMQFFRKFHQSGVLEPTSPLVFRRSKFFHLGLFFVKIA
eukprot:UN20687